MPRLLIPDSLRAAVLQRHAEGASYADMSLEFGVGFHVIFKIKKEAGLIPPRARPWFFSIPLPRPPQETAGG